MISNEYALTGEFADSFTEEILKRVKLLPADPSVCGKSQEDGGSRPIGFTGYAPKCLSTGETVSLSFTGNT